MKPDVLRLLQEKNDKIEFEVVITSLCVCVCVCVCFVVLSFVCVCVWRGELYSFYIRNRYLGWSIALSI